jgi:hypothetical protein
MTTATATARFEVGQTYYGSLACAHGHFPVTCIKRTAKCVWFEHATKPEHYPAARCKIHDGGKYEGANFHRWHISSSQYDTSCDMQFA